MNKLIIIYGGKYVNGLIGRNMSIHYTFIYIITPISHIEKIWEEIKDWEKESNTISIIEKIHEDELKASIKKPTRDKEIPHFFIYGIEKDIRTFFKDLVSGILHKGDLAIDFSAVSSPLCYDLYYFSLQMNVSEKKNIKFLLWSQKKEKDPEPYLLYTHFLEPATKIVLTCIENGFSTINDIQKKYSEIKNLGSLVSNSLISRHLGILIKQGLILIKYGKLNQYTITDKGKFLIGSIPTDFSASNPQLMGSEELIQNIVKIYQEGQNESTYNEFFTEIKNRNLSTELILEFVGAIDLKNIEILEYLEHIIDENENVDSKLLVQLAKRYFHLKSDKFIPLIQKIQKTDILDQNELDDILS